MQNASKIKGISSLIGLFFIIGCTGFSGKAYETRYYALAYPLPDTGNTHPDAPYILGMDLFCVAPEYTRNNMMYQDGEFQRGFYPYHKWAASPEKMVAGLFHRDLIHAGIFKAVLGPESLKKTTHMLEGCVDDFYGDKTDAKGAAVLTITMTFFDELEKDPKRKILLQKTYKKRVKLQKKTPAALAEAMSLALASVSEALIKDIQNIPVFSTNLAAD